ncbi:MAG: hypothetical protein U9Q83_12425 [Bacteroidota bacterium]|nr:hypothetical protein [Bacteroidota bacterium]
MKKKGIFNFIWWLSSPFFVITFFILLLLYSQGIFFFKTALALMLFIVLSPLIVEWILNRIFEISKNERVKINLILIIFSIVYTFIVNIQTSDWLVKYTFTVFAFSLFTSYIIFFLKFNQYSFLLGVFLSITILISTTQMINFVYLIIIELIFAAFLFRYFVIFKVDDLKGIFLTYSGGIITTAFFAFAVSYLSNLLKFN